MNFEESFRQTIREYRGKSGKSQDTLAKESELDRTYISLIERGKRQPTLSTLVKLSTALNVPLSELIIATEQRCVKICPAEDVLI